VDTTFRQIVSPFSPEEFFGAIWDQRPVHIPGAADKFAHVFSWEEMNRLLNMSKLWSDRSMSIVLDGRFNLPSREQAALFRVRSLGVRVDAAGGVPVLRVPGEEFPLESGEEDAASWILECDYVEASEIETRFAALGPDGVRNLLDRLEAYSVLDKI